MEPFRSTPTRTIGTYADVETGELRDAIEETGRRDGHSAGVGRETVHRWLRNDPAVIASLNAGKAEIVAATRAELRTLATVAVAWLRALLEDKNPYPNARVLQYWAVMDVLKITGVAEPEPIGPTNPAAAAVQIRAAESRRKVDELMADFPGL